MKISYLFLALTIFSNVFSQENLDKYMGEKVTENIDSSNKHLGYLLLGLGRKNTGIKEKESKKEEDRVFNIHSIKYL